MTGSLVYPDVHFVGRRRELDLLSEQLRQIDNKAVLCGMGGIGKSEIAKMYCKEHFRDYDLILWIPFDTSLEHTLADDSALRIEGLNRSDYPMCGDAEYSRKKLSLLKDMADRKVLVILDNFDVTEDADLSDFCSGPYALIITSRCQHLSSVIQEINVAPLMDREELMQLFQTEYFREIGSGDCQIIQKIMRCLEMHTLSIRLIAAAMQRRRIHPADMLRMLNAPAEEEPLGKRMNLPEQMKQRLRQVFHLSSLSVQEIYIMRNLALVSNHGIEAERFYQLCELDGYDVIDDLIDRNWIIQDAVRDVIHCHPLIAEMMLEQIAGEPECCDTMLGNLYRYVMTREVGTFSYKEKLQNAELAATAYARIPDCSKWKPGMLEAKIRTGIAISRHRQSLDDCRTLIRDSDTQIERCLYGYQALTYALISLGDYEECLEEALRGCERASVCPEDSLSDRAGYQRAMLYIRIAESYNFLGNFDKALEYIQKRYDCCERYYSVSSDNAKGWALYYKSMILYNMGRTEEGEAAINSAVEYFSREQGTDIIYVRLVLCMFMARGGDITGALGMNEACRERILDLNGEEDTATAKAWDFCAKIYALDGRTEEANKCWEKAIEIFRKQNAEKRIERIVSDREKMEPGRRYVSLLC